MNYPLYSGRARRVNGGAGVRASADNQGGARDVKRLDAIAQDALPWHYATTRHFETVDEAYREIVRAPLEYEPGCRTVYGTGTYTVIGRVLEAATGRDYQRLMREELFDLAGLDGIVAQNPRREIAARTVFYESREGGGFVPGPLVDPSHKLPGAGYLARARDIAAFGAALLRNRVIGEAGRREMFAVVPMSDGSPGECALGLRVDTHPTSGRVRHLPGGGIGISGWLFIHPEADLVIALLGNVNTAPVGGRTHRLIADAFLP